MWLLLQKQIILACAETCAGMLPPTTVYEFTISLCHDGWRFSENCEESLPKAEMLTFRVVVELLMLARWRHSRMQVIHPTPRRVSPHSALTVWANRHHQSPVQRATAVSKGRTVWLWERWLWGGCQKQVVRVSLGTFCRSVSDRRTCFHPPAQEEPQAHIQSKWVSHSDTCTRKHGWLFQSTGAH